MDKPSSVNYIETKSILSKLRGEDPHFGISYNMNLYRGCQHGCIYCDTRSDCYGIGDISKIFIKKNALELLPKELKARQKNKGTIGTGSMNDPYMHLEQDLQFTRKALQIIADYRYPVHIITKSSLVSRDTDILQEISKIYAAVSFTITTADETLTSKIEPYAPASSERFKSMKLLAEEGIYTGVTLMPVLPFVNDTIENIETLVRKAKDAGASYIIPMFGLTLREGSRDYFYKKLDEIFHGLKEKYQKEFKEYYICNSPNNHVLRKVYTDLTKKLQIPSKMKFYSPAADTEQLSLF